jgi:methylenetetrahydrofolate--tRNA-(uracil-5-)-methyltransferase
MKPFGLTNSNNPEQKPYAVIQLRQDNSLGSLWNIVGFQTKMTYEEQKRVFKTIPGLENAEFARLGGLHRNTFINSPNLLYNELNLKKSPNIYFAGQITGVEGYVESCAIGLLAGLFISFQKKNKKVLFPPDETALGSLLNHVTKNANKDTFQPMNINFGLFPNISNDKYRRVDKKLKRNLITQNAISKITEWSNEIHKIIQ